VLRLTEPPRKPSGAEETWMHALQKRLDRLLGDGGVEDLRACWGLLADGLLVALGAAISGVSLAWFLLFLILWSFIPLIAAILFLIARRIEGPSQRRRYVNDSADLW
jgi:hypothetical protein